ALPLGPLPSLANRRTPMSSLLEVNNLKVHFPLHHGPFHSNAAVVKAVDGVSFSMASGETLGLVGESGCGKSSLGRAIVGLVTPTAGEIRSRGRDVTRLRGSELRAHRRRLQMVFQDPYSSLDPRMNVENIVGEALDVHRLAKNKSARRTRIA